MDLIDDGRWRYARWLSDVVDDEDIWLYAVVDDGRWLYAVADGDRW